MSIDRTALRQLTASSPLPKSELVAMMRGIHRIPGLREWVTIESILLPPIPVWGGDRWSLMACLTVPCLVEGMSYWTAPWGAIEWSYPDYLVQTLDLRQQPQFKSLRAVRLISTQSVDRAHSSKWQSRLLQENTLYHALEIFLNASPNPDRLFTLAPYYIPLLSPALYPYYHTLIPTSQTWLRPMPLF